MLISVSANDFNCVVDVLNNVLENVYNWLCNKLKLNIDKTKYMIVG